MTCAGQLQSLVPRCRWHSLFEAPRFTLPHRPTGLLPPLPSQGLGPSPPSLGKAGQSPLLLLFSLIACTSPLLLHTQESAECMAFMALPRPALYHLGSNLLARARGRCLPLRAKSRRCHLAKQDACYINQSTLPELVASIDGSSSGFVHAREIAVANLASLIAFGNRSNPFPCSS
jgi:hypothetical protein